MTKWPAHTPSTTFWHLPLNSPRFSYATEGALFISAQLYTNVVSALRKVWVPIRLWKQPSTKARTKNEVHPLWVKKNKEFHLDLNDFGFI